MGRTTDADGEGNVRKLFRLFFAPSLGLLTSSIIDGLKANATLRSMFYFEKQ